MPAPGTSTRRFPTSNHRVPKPALRAGAAALQTPQPNADSRPAASQDVFAMLDQYSFQMKAASGEIEHLTEEIAQSTAGLESWQALEQQAQAEQAQSESLLQDLKRDMSHEMDRMQEAQDQQAKLKAEVERIQEEERQLRAEMNQARLTFIQQCWDLDTDIRVMLSAASAAVESAALSEGVEANYGPATNAPDGTLWHCTDKHATQAVDTVMAAN